MFQDFQSANQSSSIIQAKLEAARQLAGQMGLIGIINVKKINAFGEIVQETWGYNKVNDHGDNYWADVMSGTALRNGTFIAIGSGTNGGSKATFQLEFEVARGAVTGTAPWVSSGANDNDVNFQRTFTGLTANGVAEVGIFRAAAAGSCIERGTFTGVNLTSSDSLQVTVTITNLGV